MGVNFSNEESRIRHENKKYFDENIKSLPQRQIKWIQNYLASKKNISFFTTGSNDQYDELIRVLLRFDDFKGLIRSAYTEMSHSLIPEQKFGWLIDNLRGQIFTLNILYSEYEYDSFNRNNNYLMEGVYHFFDNEKNKDNVSNKISLLSDIEKRWSSVFNNESYSKWLSESNKEHIKWTKDYLKKAGIYNDVIRDSHAIKEIRSHILASLDLIDCPASNVLNNNYVNYITIDRKERIIDKMKRAWSQKKYRDAGKTKKPYHLPLTKETKYRLEKMSEVQGLSETAMLDILINRFYELEYVDINNKDLY